ncbi:hypothetical protein F2P81_014232 [Scophthalmus maximus]|uniref:Uncharacterized protein n=1 Tax=Scophthalmus maximus TaxID=52904 RepID=A0A6A4SG80_SCOMX|nr:hypothetical protein F2P81_014232 [Scophthalmus maximus]
MPINTLISYENIASWWHVWNSGERANNGGRRREVVGPTNGVGPSNGFSGPRRRSTTERRTQFDVKNRNQFDR